MNLKKKTTTVGETVSISYSHGEADFSDLVHVVRCKDCKHRDVEKGFCEGRGWPMQLVHDEGFCDKGERSEE